ncbi:MAG: hypothetical protein J6P44_01580 [Bacteroidales bacterium]|nr:hypothetical protein [Bacteroidales bacterium]
MQNKITEKLNAFIRKYYKNLVVKGIVYSLLLLILFFVVLNLIEYFGWTSVLFRTIVFYAYILLTLSVVCIWIIRPLFKLFKIGKTLTYEQAATIIGNHFSDIQDKLLNLLQLQDIAKSQENDLLSAAIEQKTTQLSPIPFQKAVDTRQTKKFSKYLFAVAIVVIALAVAFPKLFSEPSKRYINHNTFYEKPAPFTFEITSPLKAVQQSDYEINVTVKGDILPEKVNAVINGQIFEMKKKDKTHFSHVITQIQKTTSVQFEAADVYSKIYQIIVNPKPILTDLNAEIVYPAYTGIKSETVNNVTDLTVPQGTKIVWHLRTKDCSNIQFSVANLQTETKNTVYLNTDKKGNAEYTTQNIRHNSLITIKTKNEFTVSSDSIAFNINTVTDEKPFIAVIEQKDSLIADNIYFRGQIKDDYGFSRLEFHIQVTPQNSKTAKTYTKRLPVSDNENTQEFYHAENLNEYNIKQGDKVDYWFEVWDNDAVNGAKNAKSQTFTIDIPTEKQLDERLSKNSEDIKKDADKTLDEIKKLQQEINDLTKKLTEKKDLYWQDEKDLQQLKQKQEEIQEKIKEIERKIEENSLLEEKYKDIDPELLEKQKQIEDLFKQLQNKDLEELMKQLEQLTEKKLNKDQINEQLKNISKKNEDISKQLDKNLELYKRLDVEKDINDNIDKLKELAEKQKQLSEDTKNKKDSKENLQQRQEELSNEFKELQKKMDETKKKDSQLQDPFNFNQDKQKEQEINSQQQKAQENLKNNKNKNASQNQKQASEQMEQMALQMEQQLEESQDEQLAEDIDNVRQILKNLVTLSKKQENLIYDVQRTTTSDPAYQKIINLQNTVKESMQTIADSLYAISKRQPQVSKTINDETFTVMTNIENSLYNLLRFNQSYYNNYKNNQAANTQQYAMSSMNNLALLLAESLDKMNMQQQMKSNKKNNSKNAKSQCDNPSQSKSGKDPKNMRQLQEALNKEIERLSKELEKRGNQSKQQIGEGKELNERLAKAAAQQEMIRKMMQEYLNEMKKEGGKAVGQMNQAIKQMEDTEKDIVNKRITNQTLNRQKQILTRMLESEKAEMKKEKDNKRESKTGVDKTVQDNKNFEEFKKLKNRDSELFRKIPAVYAPYYKKKISDYFNTTES